MNVEDVDLLLKTETNQELQKVIKKVKYSERLTVDEGLFLYEEVALNTLGILANFIREKRHQSQTFFNRNIHIEPTNICTYKCKFCAYACNKDDAGAWEYSIEEMLEQVDLYAPNITELHIVGGVHPDRNLSFYETLLREIRTKHPHIHIKAFTAVEIDYMAKKSGFFVLEALKKLKAAGLNSIPGGGAEIFNNKIREEICGSKSKSTTWLQIHEKAHKLGISSNATMLYGHIENYAHRISHLNKLRDLQDKTHGFNSFIPLKYKNSNNELSYIEETTTIEDLRNYAVSRLFLDNIPHIKAYWPMIGKETALMSLDYGVDDFDGTISGTTKIYSMAGSNEKKPSLTVSEIEELIKSVNRIPVERDSLYNRLESNTILDDI